MGSMLDEQCNIKRAAIVALARRLADDGAHYLWGAEGQKPGERGLTLAQPVLDPAQPKKTVFCAGVLGGCVCVGRFRASGFNAMRPPEKVWDLANASGQDDVVAFIKRNQSNPAAQVGWGSELTPRLITGYADARGAPKDYGPRRPSCRQDRVGRGVRRYATLRLRGIRALRGQAGLWCFDRGDQRQSGQVESFQAATRFRAQAGRRHAARRYPGVRWTYRLCGCRKWQVRAGRSLQRRARGRCRLGRQLQETCGRHQVHPAIALDIAQQGRARSMTSPDGERTSVQGTRKRGRNENPARPGNGDGPGNGNAARIWQRKGGQGPLSRE